MVDRHVLDANGVELEFRGWIYRDLLRPIAEVDALGNVVQRYIYADGSGMDQNGVKQLETRLGANQDTGLPFAGSNVPEVIEMLSGGVVTRRPVLVKNQVGTVELAVDQATGEVVQRMEADEFGRVLLDTSPGLHPFGFAGGLYDPETHLVRFGARDYDPQIGRWTARDPVREAGGVNSYLYAESAPTVGVDWGGFKDCRSERIGAALACLTASVACAGAVALKDPYSIATCWASAATCGAEVGKDLACETDDDGDKPPKDGEKDSASCKQ